MRRHLILWKARNLRLYHEKLFRSSKFSMKNKKKKSFDRLFSCSESKIFARVCGARDANCSGKFSKIFVVNSMPHVGFFRFSLQSIYNLSSFELQVFMTIESQNKALVWANCFSMFLWIHEGLNEISKCSNLEWLVKSEAKIQILQRLNLGFALTQEDLLKHKTKRVS